MARGDASGLYQPRGVSRGSLDDLIAYVDEELWRISGVLEVALMREVEVSHVAPSRPRDGMTRLADGVDWNPGGGQGVYTYYNSTWNKLG